MPFSVEPIPGKSIIRITIRSSLTLDDVPRLATMQANLVGLLNHKAGRFDALVDCVGLPIQPVAVAEALAELSDRTDFTPRRLAFVHGTVRMQLPRVNIRKQAGFFAGEEEALAGFRRMYCTGKNDRQATTPVILSRVGTASETPRALSESVGDREHSRRLCGCGLQAANLLI